MAYASGVLVGHPCGSAALAQHQGGDMQGDLADLKQVVTARLRTAIIATHLMEDPASYIEAAIDGLLEYIDARDEVLDINEVMGERLRA